MEGLLSPYVHYVPILDDYTDLKDKLVWCNENVEKGKDILSNSKKFISQFLNYDRERLVMKKTLNRYFKNVGIIIK